MLTFLSALDAIAIGSSPDVDDWRLLSDAVNTVDSLAVHFGKLDPAEVMPAVERATQGMIAAADRFRAGKGMRLDAEGLMALREVIDIYDVCLNNLTAREMFLAQRETQRRVSEILSDESRRPDVIAL